MFQQHVEFIDVPVVCPFEGFRPTVAVLLVTPDDGIVLVHSVKAERGQWGVVQGGIEAGESVLDALKREVHEELPDVELILTGARLFGDCVNEMPPQSYRDSPDKWMCVAAVPIAALPQQCNLEEVDDFCEVRSAAALGSLLQKVRPKKREIIRHAAAQACRFELLAWNSSLIPLAA